MLANLKIENIAIIENASIDFTKGFNVMSGETGAGKSIIIDAINAVLGERTSKELIRTGTDSAKVSALFCSISRRIKNRLSEYDIDLEADDTLLIQRSINSDGRNVCKVNGSPVTVTMLKAIGKELINIHGQHDSQALLNADDHYTYIDALSSHDQLIAEYTESYGHMKRLMREIDTLNVDTAEKERRIDLLKFQIEELELAEIKAGELEALNIRRNILQNSEKILTNLKTAYDALNGTEDSGGAAALTSLSADCLESSAGFMPQLEETANSIRDMSYNLSESINDIRNFMLDMEYDPNEVEETESRLDLLYRLSRKYGQTEADMLQYLENAREELNNIIFSDEKLIKLEAAYKEAKDKTTALAQRLSESRRRTADLFEQRVKEELEFLDMPFIQFTVSQMPVGINETGADRIEFLISANAGEPPKPISKIASGGELSRIMLAFKNVLSDKDDIATLIFDEIDTGVSGRAAQKIALKLRQVSNGRQVICVTHSAQIAAQADTHLLIEKEVKDNKTYTMVSSLNIQGRTHELARIIGGLSVTELQLKNAEEMLKSANII